VPNPVTWFEIIGKDPIKLQKFYGDLFGWKLSEPMPDMGNYSIATTLMPVTDVTEGVTIALFADPEGNITGLMKSHHPG